MDKLNIMANYYIDTYGNNITITIGDKSYHSKAFIQPLQYKNKMYTDGNYTPQGYIDGGHFQYIGKADFVFSPPYEDITIKLNSTGQLFAVKRAENYIVKNKICHVSAVITPLVLQEG